MCSHYFIFGSMGFHPVPSNWVVGLSASKNTIDKFSTNILGCAPLRLRRVSSTPGNANCTCASAQFSCFVNNGAAPQKKRTHKHRRRPPAGAEVESQSSDPESGGSRRSSIGGEGIYAGGAEGFATSLTALQSELQEAQAMLNALLKKQHETKQRVIHPGGGPQPKDPGKPWCGEQAQVSVVWNFFCIY